MGVPKNTLSEDERTPFGDKLSTNNAEDTMLVGFLNVQSIPQRREGKKNFDISHMINDYGFSHMGLVETNVNWDRLEEEDRLPQRFRGHFDTNQVSFNPAHNRQDKLKGRRQAGGTLGITAGKMVGSIAPKGRGRDPTGLGRYNWTRYRGKNNITLRIVTFYRPCKPTTAGSVYSQHATFFDQTGRDGCPREALLNDLKEEIKKWREEGDQIILMGDVNEYIHSSTMKKWADETGLRELITERHGLDGPATTMGREKREAIDGVWGTAGVKITEGGYLPLHKRIKSNHRMLWIKLSLVYMLGGKDPCMNKIPARMLTMEDKQAQKRYKKIVKKYLRRHKVQERMDRLMKNARYPLSIEEMREYEAIEKLREEARKRGERGCRKMYVSGVESHPEVKKARLALRLIDSLISRKEGTGMTKWRSIQKMAMLVDGQHLLKLKASSLWSIRPKYRKSYYDLKKKKGTLRSTRYEEHIKKLENEGELEEAVALNEKLKREKEREKHKRLRLLNNKERNGVRTVQVEKTVYRDNEVVRDSKGDPITIRETKYGKDQVEVACLEEVSQRSRMSELSPPMSEPLVNMLEYTGITDFSDEVLNGEASLPPEIDEYTRIYLQQLRRIESCIQKPVQQTSFEEYSAEVKRLRERTSSGSSRVTPAMIKTELTDDYTADINWKASNFTWCTGYSPKRFREGLDLLIHKKPNDNRVSKLRPILLFDIEANMHNKRLGRYAMQLAEEANGIALEQFGSRRRLSADLQALNTRLFYDHVLLERTPATSTFIDLVSNYDLVVHSIAAMALQRVGVPKEPILCTFTTLQDMVHTCRTAFGDSERHYGGDVWAIPCKPPPQGLGQGNGAAPTIWALVSTPILNALREKGYGAAFKCCISKKKFKLVGYCFVDDSTIVQMAPTPDTPAHKLVEKAQQEIDLYAGLAAATGGQVSPEASKNSWYLMEFEWDQHGKWKLVDNEADLFINTKEGRRKINRLPTKTASRILGVWLAPNGCNKKQVEVLKETTSNWADRVRSGHIRKEDAWFYYQSTVMKSLEYPLLATTLSKDQCTEIEWPALQVALKTAGLPSNFPRDILYGPTENLGLGAPRLYTTQGIKHVRALMDHGMAENITGEQLRACIERHKMEVGTGYSLFANNYHTFEHCITNTWIKNMWKFMADNNILVEERTSNLEKARENDKFLMEEFATGGFEGEELATLNRCRCYLQATTLADIVSGDGKTVLEAALKGERNINRSQYTWAPQSRPPKKAWDKWEEAIGTIFKLRRASFLPPQMRLGRWLKDNAPTGWVYSPQLNHLYEQTEQGWKERSPVIERRGRGTYKRFNDAHTSNDPPPDAMTTRCIISRGKITSTGCEMSIRATDDQPPTTLQERMHTGSDEKRWAMEDVRMEDDGEYIAQAIQTGSAVAVSDGSFKNSRSAAACILEGSLPGKGTIIASATTPGHKRVHDPYRGELTGILMIAIIVNEICRHYNIKRGGIRVACDGIEALKKALDRDTHYNCRSSQFDLISAIRNQVKASPIKWEWEHVKGHQDDHYGPLDRLATLNVQMDEEAKKRRRRDEDTNQLTQQKIDGELWRLYLIKETEDGLPELSKVETKTEDNLKKFIEGRKAVTYWVKHYTIPEQADNKVDWGAIKHAREKRNFYRNKWGSKYAADSIATGSAMQDRGAWKTASCPRNCGEELEAPEHVYQCTKADNLWKRLVEVLMEWSPKQDIAPGIMAAITTGIGQWRKGEEYGLGYDYDGEVKKAFEAQTQIGWEAATKGILTTRWQDLQNAYFGRKKSRRRGVRAIAAIIRKLWDVSWDMWQHRNNCLHGNSVEEYNNIIKQLQERVKYHHGSGHRSVHWRSKTLLKIPLKNILSTSTRQQTQWLQAIVSSKLRYRIHDEDFRQESHPDLILIKRICEGGILDCRKEPAEQKLRTTSRPTRSLLMHIARDWSEIQDDDHVTITPFEPDINLYS